MAYKNNLAILGLTAAGKTTHARLLVKEFNLQYVSASQIIIEKAGIVEPVDRNFWVSPRGRELTRRTNELNIDEALVEKENSINNAVFDCRSISWLAKNKVFSIWLESSLYSRTLKAQVSHGKEKQGFLKTQRNIHEKDIRERNNILQKFKIDIFTNRGPIDAIIDISDFITDSTYKASTISIKKAQEIISALVGAFLTQEEIYKKQLIKLTEKYNKKVFVRLPILNT